MAAGLRAKIQVGFTQRQRRLKRFFATPVFMSDTQTNACVDDVSQVKKMSSREVPGERVITLLSAANLATTQAVVSLVAY